MGAQTLAQTAIYITATKPASYDEAGWTAIVDWVKIGLVTNTGGHGDTVTAVTYEPLDEDRVRKLKGTVDGGTETYTFVSDITDAGQVLLKTALASKDSYSFKEVWQDLTEEFFAANVNGGNGSGGGVNAVRGGTVDIDIDTATVTVPYTP